MARSIVALQRSSYAVEARAIGYGNLPPLRETVEDVRHSKERFLAVREGDGLAGVVSYSREGGTVEVCRLVVRPDLSCRGIASTLLAAVERAEPDARTFTVSTASANLPALALYRANGYRMTETRALPDGLLLTRLDKRLP